MKATTTLLAICLCASATAQNLNEGRSTSVGKYGGSPLYAPTMSFNPPSRPAYHYNNRSSAAPIKPYGAVWLCDMQGNVIGSINAGVIYDREGNEMASLREGQTKSTRVGEYGGSPIGVPRCKQWEVYKDGTGVGCLESTWNGISITDYQGREVLHTCQ